MENDGSFITTDVKNVMYGESCGLFVAFNSVAINEYIQNSPLYSEPDKMLMLGCHSFWFHSLVEHILGDRLNPQYLIGFMIPILSWNHLVRTAGYLF